MNRVPNSGPSSGPNALDPDMLLEGLGEIRWKHRAKRTVPGSFQFANLYGYMNPLRGTAIQIVDKDIVEWLYSISSDELRNAPCFSESQCAAIVICDQLEANPVIEEACKDRDISLLVTSRSANSVLDYLQSHIPRLVSPRCNKHGVFLAVMNTGVLITGASGIGKSEVALDLIQRGHQLIADDSVELFRSDAGDIVGECPESLRGHIEIRGLGIINIERMFGPTAVLKDYKLQLIINLEDGTSEQIRGLDRLQPSMEQKEILGVEIPCLGMLVEPGRNLSVLVEAAIQDHLLRMSGVDSSMEFVSKHDQLMGVDSEQ